MPAIIPLLFPALLLASSQLAPDLEEFLGAPPPRFEARFRKPARELKAALELLSRKKNELGRGKLQSLLVGELGEHAGFALTRHLRESGEFSRSSAQAEKLLRAYPGSPYADQLRELLDDNECDQALVARGNERLRLLQLCLWRSPWKGWAEREAQAGALYELLKSAKDPLFEPLVSELLQALPPANPLRQRLARELPGEQLDRLAELARYRTRSVSPPGMKPVSPDGELFDAAMKLVLKQDWPEAARLFRRFPAEFPQSEHWERAQYWIARSEEQLGNKEEARRRFEQLLSENPFTYYGLQASLRLKQDWGARAFAPAAAPAARWRGALLTRQAVALWRLRALLEAGLGDFAREEAKTLAAAKANGAGIGQEDPQGALLMARLFHEAGHDLAAFSHAYAALSLDPSLLNAHSLKLIFPFRFVEEFRNATERSGVNSLLLLSVAKQESAFAPNAVSRADALGLLQLLPSTARELLPELGRRELLRPGPNAETGALYLYKMLDRFQGNIALALAAYNAGPTRALAWQKELGESPLFKAGFDTDAFIDSIPYTETRRYVGNILRNYAWYRLLSREGQMGEIQELIYQWQKSEKKLQAP